MYQSPVAHKTVYSGAEPRETKEVISHRVHKTTDATMADSDLEAIRQARMQELQSQSGGGQDSQKEEQKYIFPKTYARVRGLTYIQKP